MDIIYQDNNQNLKKSSLLYFSDKYTSNNDSNNNKYNFNSNNDNILNSMNNPMTNRLNDSAIYNQPNNIINTNNYRSINVDNFKSSPYLNFKSSRNIYTNDYSIKKPIFDNKIYPNNYNINNSRISQNELNNIDNIDNINNINNMNENNDNGQININNRYNININENGINKNIENNNINSMNNNLDNSGPFLPDEVINAFSSELRDIYSNINQFLVNEPIKISQEIEELNRKKDTNKKLKDLRDTEELNEYNDLFNQIYTNVKDNSNRTKKKLELKLKVFNMIKLNCEETFNFICNNSYRPNIFKDKLNILLTHINDYYTTYNSKNNNSTINLNPNYMSIINNGNQIYNANSLNTRYGNNLIENNKINLFRSGFNNNISLRNNNQFRGGVDRYNYQFHE